MIMPSLLSLSLFTILLFISSSSSFATTNKETNPQKPPAATNSPPEILQACKATSFPDVCESSLSDSKNVPPNSSPSQIIKSAIGVSTENLKTAQSMVKKILDDSGGNLNRTNAAKICLEVLDNSQYRISSADDALKDHKNKDARAWLGAAVAYQYDCWSAIKYVNSTAETNSTMSFLDTLIHMTSNALSMVMAYDIYGDKTESWGPPKTERDGFWEEGSDSKKGDLGFKAVFPSKLKADVTVGKDKGDHKSVQEAVDKAPENLKDEKKYVVHIAAGVYKEIVRIPLKKKNLVFIGDGIGKTVITGSLTVGQPGMTTYNTATVGVLGDGFMATGITFENTAGAPTHQAVAFRSDSDLSYIENCEFLGNQDTVYAHSLRQYYKSCRIQGNVDFIFGNSAAFFQDCTILVGPRLENPEKGESNAVTAHGRIDPAQPTGFVFHNCSIDGTEKYMELYKSKPSVHKNYLGRPWKDYSRVVFLNCQLEALINPEGWMPWDGDKGLETLYYGEFKNSGPGADVSKRVKWSNQIPEEHVNSYSVQNFIQGDKWLPTS